MATTSGRKHPAASPPKLQLALRRASIVHDIGKVAVSDQISLNRGPLTADERKVMKHPLDGERVCAPLESFRARLVG